MSMFRLTRWLCQGNVFVLIFTLVQHVAPLCLQWPLAQLFPAAWAGVLSQCSVYLSLMSMGKSLLLVCSQISNKNFRYPWSVYV
jgi:hypothetical protein